MAPERPADPRDFPAFQNDTLRRIRELERQVLRLPDGADPLQTFEDGTPLGPTRFLDFGQGIIATLIGDDYVQVRGAGGTRWGTVVVAASDTHDEGKAQADFLCTGTADQTTLDLALDAAPSGGEIVLLEGTYVISDNWSIDEDNIHIRGMGTATVLSGTDASGTTAVIELAADNIRISQMRIVKTSGTGDFGIRHVLDGFDDCRVEQVMVEGFTRGIRMRGFRWQVRDCYLLNNGIGINGFTDIDSARGLITGNVVVGGTTGIVVENDCEYTAIVGNRCSTQSSQAISVNSAFCSVVNNTVHNGGSNPIGNSASATDCVFVGNIVTGSGGGAGMNMNGGRTTVMGNHINAPTAIGIDMACDDSTCIGNTVRSAGTIGIRVLTHLRNVVSGNNVSLCGQQGILVSTNAHDNTIQGNTIYQCGQSADNTYDGILISGSDRNDVQNNTVRQGAGANDHRYGINVDLSSSEDNLVCNNDLFDSAQTAAFNDTGTNTRACTDGGLSGGGTPATIDGHVIEDEGTPLTQRANLNFAGGGVTATDSAPDTLVTIPGPNIAEAFFAAKGDLISATANDTPSIVTVGADPKVLTADSAAASGLSYLDTRRDLGLWFQDNVAATQTNVALNLYGDTTRSAIPMIRAGSITGIVVRSNEARTAGTLTVEVTKNGTGVGLTAVLDGTNTTFKATTQAQEVDTFSAGDEVGVVITTDAGWLPITADISVLVEVAT